MSGVVSVLGECVTSYIDASELEFVGEGRKLLFEDLVSISEQTSDALIAVLVAQELRSGWGKIRISRNFNAKLGESQRFEPKYWPESFFSSRYERHDINSVHARRQQKDPSSPNIWNAGRAMP